MPSHPPAGGRSADDEGRVAAGTKAFCGGRDRRHDTFLSPAICRRRDAADLFQGLSQDDIPRHTARGSIGARAQRRCGFPVSARTEEAGNAARLQGRQQEPRHGSPLVGIGAAVQRRHRNRGRVWNFVVDVDGVDAELELRRLEAAHGALPTTVDVITARGRHLYFKVPDTRCATPPAGSRRVSTCAATAATCWRRRVFTRAAARTRGLSIARTQSSRRRTSCWPGLPGTLTAAAR